MGILRYKLFRDLWSNKGRTLQVVLIIGIGAAALGMIIGVRNMVVLGMEQIWQEMNPATIMYYVFPGLEEDDLYVIQRDPEVADLEPFSAATIEWRLSDNEEWKQATLTTRQDFANQRINKLDWVAGEWPHGQTMSITPESETVYKIPSDGSVQVRINRKVYTVQTGGQLYDQWANPASFGGTAQFYASPEYYEYLTDEEEYNRLLVAPNFEYEEQKATDLADRLADQMERMGNETFRIISDPHKHFFQDSIDGIFTMLGVLGILSLLLGLLLSYNTINTIVLSQIDQIGVMKAIGARTSNIVGYFFRLVMIYGLISLAIALPAAIFGAWGMTAWLINSFGADPGEFTVDNQAIVITAIVAVLAPLISALVPIWLAGRTTVREAISTYGLSTKAGLIDRVVSKLRFLSRMIILTVSNTFRHKARVTLLQLALVVSGLVFMMVIGVRDSVVYTVRDVLFQILNANITMALERNEPIDYIEKLVYDYPGTVAVESWGLANVTGRLQGQPYSDDDDSLLMFGVPLPTELYGYQLISGRWLVPGDQFALVINSKQARDMEVEVGDWLTIRYGEKNERAYQIVGTVFDPVLTNTVLVPREPMLHDLGTVGRTPVVWVKTENDTLEGEVTYAKGLRQYLEANHIQVSSSRGIFGISESNAEVANMLISQFNFLIVLLGVMAVVIGAVGSIALGGALSLSVLERRREIGVMRAIGASAWSIFRLFIGEGLILGWLSWLIALPIALPASRFMVQMLGQAFNIDIMYNFTPAGPVMWLAIITILSIFASILPARGATRISVRESLAYQ